MKNFLMIAFVVAYTFDFRPTNAFDGESYRYTHSKIFNTGDAVSDKKEAWNVFLGMPKDGEFHECVIDGTPSIVGQCKLIRVHEPVERHLWELEAHAD